MNSGKCNLINLYGKLLFKARRFKEEGNKAMQLFNMLLNDLHETYFHVFLNKIYRANSNSSQRMKRINFIATRNETAGLISVCNTYGFLFSYKKAYL